MFFSPHIIGSPSLLGSINSIVPSSKSCNLSISPAYLYSPSSPRPIFITPLSSIIPPPASAARTTMVTPDRHPNGCSPDTIRGGDVLSSQHLPRPPRHPEVHTLTLPGSGSTSEIPPTLFRYHNDRLSNNIDSPPFTFIL